MIKVFILKQNTHTLMSIEEYKEIINNKDNSQEVNFQSLMKTFPVSVICTDNTGEHNKKTNGDDSPNVIDIFVKFIPKLCEMQPFTVKIKIKAPNDGCNFDFPEILSAKFIDLSFKEANFSKNIQSSINYPHMDWGETLSEAINMAMKHREIIQEHDFANPDLQTIFEINMPTKYPSYQYETEWAENELLD